MYSDGKTTRSYQDCGTGTQISGSGPNIYKFFASVQPSKIAWAPAPKRWFLQGGFVSKPVRVTLGV